MSQETKTDIELRVNNIPSEDLHRVWDVISRMGQAMALDGYEVVLETWRQDDDDDDPTNEVISIGPGGVVDFGG